jgi:hypothetical protein
MGYKNHSADSCSMAILHTSAESAGPIHHGVLSTLVGPYSMG